MVPPASKMPTTSHALSPHRCVDPRSMPANWAAALRPTMISLVPGRKVRPSTMRTSSRTRNAAGSTPRRGTLAGVPVLRLGTSTTTNSSADATAPSAERRTPGASLMTRVLSRGRPLLSSVSLPPRMTMAVSGEPAPARAARNPSAMESTATKTTTTPATPVTATRDEPARCGTVRSVSAIIVKTWDRKRIVTPSATRRRFAGASPAPRAGRRPRTRAGSPGRPPPRGRGAG